MSDGEAPSASPLPEGESGVAAAAGARRGVTRGVPLADEGEDPPTRQPGLPRARQGDVSRTGPAEIAKVAMDRARASARERGARRASPRAAAIKRAANARATDGNSSPHPFGGGRDPRDMAANVEALLRRMGWTEHIEVASVTARWREVIGDQIADHCEPVSFEEGSLTLRTSSSAWATQMQLMSGQVRHRLNEEFGREVVRDLRFIGPIDKSWARGPRRVKGRGPRDTYG